MAYDVPGTDAGNEWKTTKVSFFSHFTPLFLEFPWKKCLVFIPVFQSKESMIHLNSSPSLLLSTSPASLLHSSAKLILYRPSLPMTRMLPLQSLLSSHSKPVMAVLAQQACASVAISPSAAPLTLVSPQQSRSSQPISTSEVSARERMMIV